MRERDERGGRGGAWSHLTVERCHQFLRHILGILSTERPPTARASRDAEGRKRAKSDVTLAFWCHVHILVSRSYSHIWQTMAMCLSGGGSPQS